MIFTCMSFTSPTTLGFQCSENDANARPRLTFSMAASSVSAVAAHGVLAGLQSDGG